jgi:class 3 adenylate cyclase
LWQLSGPPKDTAVINFDLLTNSEFAQSFRTAYANKESLLSEVLDVSELLGGDAQKEVPESLLLQPVFNDATSNAPVEVVGAVVAVVSWDVFLSDLVRESNQGLICVLENSCGQSYTYRMDGTNAVFLGEGDLHDRDYNYLAYETEVAPFLTIDDETVGYCKYMLYIYPTEQMEDDHKNFLPAIFTTTIVLIFLAVSGGFVAYDILVRRKQREAMTTAARSNAIVSSLFPAEIRDRLFNGEDQSDSGKKADTKSHMPIMLEPQKYRLKHYLDEDGPAADYAKEVHESVDILQGRPIADLFPNTTVMFADIAGFTAWSSVREPSQVFTLLETIYRAFDKSAKRGKVFKVETVGDCYVAVTGLPEPIKDHAIVMCHFARECMTQFNELSTKLEVILGPDTGDLAIRVGVHSGPVTAGVLRGDKSRFQLFGDTVNTAARVESTGQRNKIHLSHETAELLYKDGKSNWLQKRSETVMAKGKGEMQTYWLLTTEQMKSGGDQEDGAKGAAPLPIVNAMQSRIAKGAMDILDPESSLPPRIKRLVDWNVDVLKRLLKQVVAQRNSSGNETFDLNDPVMVQNEVNIGSQTYVLDEVEEIIRLPGYKTHEKIFQDPTEIELTKEVEDQLRLYVASIAAMHRDNPFHNFEHASHVMMSVSKLLSRIVAPDDLLQNENRYMSLHDHTYGITSDPLTQFSVVLAALIHDVDHSGVSNFQLVQEDSKIATVFKNKSVAEQNSIVLAWDRLMESRFVNLRNLIYSNPDELKRFRQLMVNTVLATDIFDKELQTLRKNRWNNAFHRFDQMTILDSSAEDDVNRKATIVIEHLIQASDVAHTMQHWHIYEKWNERLFAEMSVAFQQGRMGKDPAEGWYKGELGFFDNYIIPLAKKLKECGVFGVSSEEYLNYALENRREWSSNGEETVARYIEKYGVKEAEVVDAVE